MVFYFFVKKVTARLIFGRKLLHISLNKRWWDLCRKLEHSSCRFQNTPRCWKKVVSKSRATGQNVNWKISWLLKYFRQVRRVHWQSSVIIQIYFYWSHSNIIDIIGSVLLSRLRNWQHSWRIVKYQLEFEEETVERLILFIVTILFLGSRYINWLVFCHSNYHWFVGLVLENSALSHLSIHNWK